MPTATAKGLFKFGIVSPATEMKYQIWKHYTLLIDNGIKPYTAALDCSIHFDISVRYVYQARREISEIKKAYTNDASL